MSADLRAHHVLEHRLEKLEQHVDDLTRAVAKLTEMLLEGRHDEAIVEVYHRSSPDGGVPAIDLRKHH